MYLIHRTVSTNLKRKNVNTPSALSHWIHFPRVPNFLDNRLLLGTSCQNLIITLPVRTPVKLIGEFIAIGYIFWKRFFINLTTEDGIKYYFLRIVETVTEAV